MISARTVTTIATALISIFILTSTLLAQASDTSRYWAQWRGPHASGVSPTANPPLEWNESKNIRWKVEIPGRGSASPIVWGDRVFVLTAVPVGIAGDAQHAPRGSAHAARCPSFRGDGARSQDRQDHLGTRGP